MNISDFKKFAKNNILTTTEVAEFLKVTRQRVNALVKSKELVPFKQTQQISLFFRADIEQYIQNKKVGPHIKYGRSTEPKFFDNSGTTRKALKYFYEHKDLMGEVSEIYIYFDEIDAVLDNFYINSGRVYGELYDLDIPHLVLKDKNGEELWLGGCNCGYGGEGPHGSKEILKNYILDEELINLIFTYRVVKFIKDDDNKFEAFYHNSSCDPFSSRSGGNANLYLHKNKLILIQDSRYFYSDSEATLDRYQAFIPNPTELLIIPTYEEAISLGYVMPENYNEQAYRLIITDSSGRQLWLDPSFNEESPISGQEELCNLLEKCGFSVPNEKDLLEIDSPFAKATLSWLKSRLRRVPVGKLLLKK